MGNLVLTGATSGSTTIAPTDAVTATLTLPSSTGTLLSTANPQSGGVIQVVQGSTTTEQSTSSTSFVDTNVTATITPKFATSKILAIACVASCAKNGATDLYLQLVRNGSLLAMFGAGWVGYTNSTAYNGIGNADICYLDSPATTSALTYKIQIKSEASGTVWINGSNTFSSMTLIEVAA